MEEIDKLINADNFDHSCREITYIIAKHFPLNYFYGSVIYFTDDHYNIFYKLLRKFDKISDIKSYHCVCYMEKYKIHLEVAKVVKRRIENKLSLDDVCSNINVDFHLIAICDKNEIKYF